MQNIWIVDAFTNEPFCGGPAGVMFFEQFPGDAVMQNISTELGFSNCAFLQIKNGAYHIRWFTPTSEAPLCGHATVATLHVMQQEGLIKDGAELAFRSLSGELQVGRSGVWNNLNFPAFPMEKIDKDFNNLIDVPYQYIGVGQNVLMMEVASEEVLYILTPDLIEIAKLPYRALLVTARGNKYDFLSRYFAPSVGINEDPVCASAHSRLIPYWSNKLGKKDMLAYQASKRGGLLKCQDLGNRVLISGEAVTILKGQIDIQKIKVKYAA